MKNRILALALLSALATPALAADHEGGYLVGTLGTTSKMSNTVDSTSAVGLIGYQFNEVLAVEGGMGLLFTKAAYTTIPATGYTASSLSGTQVAAVVNFPLDEMSFFVRLGYTSASRSNEINGATNELWEENWKGSILGVGLQGMLPFEIGGVKIGLRAGIDRYSLSNSAGTSSETPLNTYVGGLIYF